MTRLTEWFGLVLGAAIVVGLILVPLALVVFLPIAAIHFILKLW